MFTSDDGVNCSHRKTLNSKELAYTVFFKITINVLIFYLVPKLFNLILANIPLCQHYITRNTRPSA